MIDYNKVREYMATMAINSNGGFQLSALSVNEILGDKQYIAEKDLHDGFEWLKAKMNKEVEENRIATNEQKENEKSHNEFILNILKEGVKSYLKSQNRLLS